MPNCEHNFGQIWASFSAGKNFTILVGDLVVDVKYYLLQETFRAHYPSVKAAKFVIDRLTRCTNAYMFVMFEDESERLRAVTEIKGVFSSTRSTRIAPPATSRKTATCQQQYLKGCQKAPSSRGQELILAARNNILARRKECNNRTCDPMKGPFLPHDIIFEILSRVPAESLLRFKCVCKQWHSLIQDDRFVMQHFSRSPILFVHNIYQSVGLNIDWTIQEQYSYMYSFGGLTVEKGNVFNKYRVRNVTTRQIIYLPDPHPFTFRMFISNDHTTNGEFKVVSIYGNGTLRIPVGLEVLTIDRDDSWRPLNSFPVTEHRIQVYMTLGLIHLTTHIMDDKNGSDYRLAVYSLDMGSELFIKNILPCTMSRNQPERIGIMNWDGCLSGYELVEENNMKVIRLEDFRKHMWNEFVVPLTFFKEEENQDLKNVLATTFIQGKLLICDKMDRDKMFPCDLESRKLTDKFRYRKGNRRFTKIRASLVTFKGMQPSQQKF